MSHFRFCFLRILVAFGVHVLPYILCISIFSAIILFDGFVSLFVSHWFQTFSGFPSISLYILLTWFIYRYLFIFKVLCFPAKNSRISEVRQKEGSRKQTVIPSERKLWARCGPSTPGDCRANRHPPKPPRRPHSSSWKSPLEESRVGSPASAASVQQILQKHWKKK